MSSQLSRQQPVYMHVECYDKTLQQPDTVFGRNKGGGCMICYDKTLQEELQRLVMTFSFIFELHGYENPGKGSI